MNVLGTIHMKMIFSVRGIDL